MDRLIDIERERKRDDSCVYLLAASVRLSLQTINVRPTSKTVILSPRCWGIECSNLESIFYFNIKNRGEA